jgi:hypothetical protein
MQRLVQIPSSGIALFTCQEGKLNYILLGHLYLQVQFLFDKPVPWPVSSQASATGAHASKDRWMLHAIDYNHFNMNVLAPRLVRMQGVSFRASYRAVSADSRAPRSARAIGKAEPSVETPPRNSLKRLARLSEEEPPEAPGSAPSPTPALKTSASRASSSVSPVVDEKKERLPVSLNVAIN